MIQKRYLTNRGLQLTSFMIQKRYVADLLWSKNVTSQTGESNLPPLVQKRHVTDRGGSNWPFRCLDTTQYTWSSCHYNCYPHQGGSTGRLHYRGCHQHHHHRCDVGRAADQSSWRRHYSMSTLRHATLQHCNSTTSGLIWRQNFQTIWSFFYREEVQMNFRLNGGESISIPPVCVIIFPWENSSVWLASILLWIFFGVRWGRERVVGRFVYFIISLHQYRHPGGVFFSRAQ